MEAPTKNPMVLDDLVEVPLASPKEPQTKRRRRYLLISIWILVASVVVVAVSVLQLREDVRHIDASGATGTVEFSDDEIHASGGLRPALKKNRWGHDAVVKKMQCTATLKMPETDYILGKISVDAPKGYPLAGGSERTVKLDARLYDVDFDAAWLFLSSRKAQSLRIRCDMDIHAGFFWNAVRITKAHTQTLRIPLQPQKEKKKTNDQSSSSSSEENQKSESEPTKAAKAQRFMERLRSSVSIHYAEPSFAQPAGELELRVDLGQWDYVLQMPNKLIDRLDVVLPRVAYDLFSSNNNDGGLADEERQRIGTLGLVGKTYTLFAGPNDLEVATFADPVPAAALRKHVDDRRWEVIAKEQKSFFGLLFGERHHAALILEPTTPDDIGRRLGNSDEAYAYCLGLASCGRLEIDDAWTIRACGGNDRGLCASIDFFEGDVILDGHVVAEEQMIDARFIADLDEDESGLRITGSYNDTDDDTYSLGLKIATDADGDDQVAYVVGSAKDMGSNEYAASFKIYGDEDNLVFAIKDDIFLKTSDDVYALVNDVRYSTSLGQWSSGETERFWGTAVLDTAMAPETLTGLLSVVRNKDEKWLEVAFGVSDNATKTTARLAAYPHTDDIDDLIEQDLFDKEDDPFAFFYIGHDVDLTGWIIPDGWYLAFKGSTEDALSSPVWWQNSAEGSYYAATTAKATVTGTYAISTLDGQLVASLYGANTEGFVNLTAVTTNATVEHKFLVVPSAVVTYETQSRATVWNVELAADLDDGDAMLLVENKNNSVVLDVALASMGKTYEKSEIAQLKGGLQLKDDDWSRNYTFEGFYDVTDTSSYNASARVIKNGIDNVFTTFFCVDVEDMDLKTISGQEASLTHALLYVGESMEKIFDVTGELSTKDQFQLFLSDVHTQNEFVDAYVKVPSFDFDDGVDAELQVYLTVDGNKIMDEDFIFYFNTKGPWTLKVEAMKLSTGIVNLLVAAKAQYKSALDLESFTGLRIQSAIWSYDLPWSSKASSKNGTTLDTADVFLLGLGAPDDSEADLFLGLRWFGTSDDDAVSSSFPLYDDKIHLKERLIVDLDLSADAEDDVYWVDFGSRVVAFSDTIKPLSQRISAMFTVDYVDDDDDYENATRRLLDAGDVLVEATLYELDGATHATVKALGDRSVVNDTLTATLAYKGVTSDEDDKWEGQIDAVVDWTNFEPDLTAIFQVNDDVNITLKSTTTVDNGTVILDSASEAVIAVNDATYVLTAEAGAQGENGATPGYFDGQWRLVNAATEYAVATWTGKVMWFVENVPSSIWGNTTLWIFDVPKFHAILTMKTDGDLQDEGSIACLDADVNGVMMSSLMNQKMALETTLAFEHVDRMWGNVFRTIEDAHVVGGTVDLEMSGLIDTDSDTELPNKITGGSFDDGVCDVTLTTDADLFVGDVSELVTATLLAPLAPTPMPTTAYPTETPTSAPSYCPSGVPTTWPTHGPSSVPSPKPTETPTSGPTPSPTSVPSPAPSESPTPVPTVSPQPTPVPSMIPTPVPTATPNPSTTPSSAPTPGPTTPGPTLLPTSSPSFVPTSSPTMVPTPMPSPIPTTAVPSAVPTIAIVEINFVFNYSFPVAETSEGLSNAQVKTRAVGFGEAICLDAGFAVVVEDLTIASYLDSSDATYPTDQSLSYIEVNCTIDSAVGEPSDSGTIISQTAIIDCTTWLIYGEARTSSDFTTSEIIDKLATYFDDEMVNNTAFPSTLETAITTETTSACNASFLNTDTSDISVRRKLIGASSSLAGSSVSSVSVTASTVAPTTVPTSCPSSLPTQVPSGATCFYDSDCPGSQTCAYARRKLSFGSLGGVCRNA